MSLGSSLSESLSSLKKSEEEAKERSGLYETMMKSSRKRRRKGKGEVDVLFLVQTSLFSGSGLGWVGEEKWWRMWLGERKEKQKVAKKKVEFGFDVSCASLSGREVVRRDALVDSPLLLQVLQCSDGTGCTIAQKMFRLAREWYPRESRNFKGHPRFKKGPGHRIWSKTTKGRNGKGVFFLLSSIHDPLL